MALEQDVDGVPELLQGRDEVPLVADVAEEFLAQELLPGVELQHPELLAQVVDEVGRLDADRLEVFLLLVLLARAAGVESVEEDLLPVDLLLLFLLFLLFFLLLLGGLLALVLFLGLQQLQERIGEQLLFEVLLEVHHGHVQHVHGLVEPRIDPELLAEPDLLGEAGPHEASSIRWRSRAVIVGPRYSSATWSL